MQGFLNIFKPTGMTSHDIVSRVRRLTGIRQVGHTGTLDPNASGVLPVAVGKATKAIPYLDEGRKVYRAELRLGADTDTGDRYGVILEETEDKVRGKAEFLQAAEKLTGQIDQVPPIYSAIRIEGKRAYDLARMGKKPQMQTRRVHIESIELISFEESSFIFDVACSKGTYVRSLCRDLAHAMGSLGCMSMLIRLESGIFAAEKAIYDWTQIEDKLMPIEDVLVHFPQVRVNEEAEKRLLYGQTMAIQSQRGGGLVRVYGPSRFLGIAKQQGRTMKMVKQFV